MREYGYAFVHTVIQTTVILLYETIEISSIVLLELTNFHSFLQMMVGMGILDGLCCLSMESIVPKYRTNSVCLYIITRIHGTVKFNDSNEIGSLGTSLSLSLSLLRWPRLWFLLGPALARFLM